MKRTLLPAVVAVLVVAACTPPPPPPVVAPQGDDRFLVDPRIGYTNVPPPLNERFDRIWQAIRAGQDSTARADLESLRAKNPNYLPAQLADAVIAIHDNNLNVARMTVERVLQRNDYLAADIYEAEIAIRSGDVRRGADLYARLAANPDLPEVIKDRIASIRQRTFDDLVTSAMTAPPADSVAMLRQALTINPAAADVRLSLVQKLLAQRNWDDARATLDPLVGSDPDRPEVQEALAEIEVGRGQFEQAIVRYDRLVHRVHDPRFERRLEEIKAQWNAANMPPQFIRASESESITRADLAVLMYWKIASVRFAQNFGTPPIAVDIEDVFGREEIIRAIALGILPVDPVTRRVGPNVTVTAGALTRYAARALSMRGAACAHGINDASRILNACSVTDPSITLPPDAPISGRAAESVIEEIDRVLSK